MLIATIGLAVTAGCGVGGSVSGPVDPPPVGAVPDSGQSPPAGETVQATLYFANPQGYVVPVAEPIPKVNAVATQTLQYMVKGGPGEAAARKWGLQTVLPAGTKVLGMDIKDGVARVDFSKEVLQYKTPAEERQIVDSIVWALTEFPTIKQVQILVNGRIIPSMPVAGTPVGQPLSRAMGINLSVSGTVNPSETEKLTLYYRGGDGNHSYLVPVTKVLPEVPGTDVVKETIEQLSQPGLQGLQSPLAGQVKVVHTALDGNVATVDFDRNFWAGGQKPDQAVAAVVLSLAQNAHVSRVKLTVNGDVPVIKGLDLSQPVTVPKAANRLEL